MFKKREKIDKQEVFDSLLFSFEKSASDATTITFRLASTENMKSHLKFSITVNDIMKYKDNPIILFEPESHKPTIPFFKQQLDSDGKVVSFILVLKEFLENANSLVIESLKNKDHVLYHITSECDDFTTELSFYESDMYPSVSKYIINTTADAIYKKAMKGNK